MDGRNSEVPVAKVDAHPGSHKIALLCFPPLNLLEIEAWNIRLMTVAVGAVVRWRVGGMGVVGHMGPVPLLIARKAATS